MKKYLIFLALNILYFSLLAQDNEFKTIFNRKNEPIKISGFGGPMMQFTSLNNEFCHMMGGGGGVMVGNTFFGGYGLGKTNTTSFKYDSNYQLGYGFGGLWLGYIFSPRSPIHLSISTQMGWGSVSKLIKYPDGSLESSENYPIFVLTPIAELEFNFSRFFKLGAGLSYNWVTGDGVTLTPYSNQDLSSLALSISFKFGWFN